MPTPPIYNSIAGSDLHIIELTDPNVVQFHADSLANQINAYRMAYSPQKRVKDLSDWIADVVIETSVQGSSLLEVHVIDPALTLLMRDANGVSFIDADENGYLWPPVEVTFPKDISDATWRLCQCRPSTSLTEANLILTFEDKIASELREHYGAQQSYPNQTRAEFIQSLIQQANQHKDLPSDVDIRFVHLLPKETFTVADLSMSQRIPASATQPYAPPARQNPNKTPHAPTGVAASNPLAAAVQGVDITIQNGYQAFLATHPFAPIVPKTGLVSPFAPPG